MSSLSRAIVHDQFLTRGGAERVAIQLAETFDAPIYCMVADEGVVPDAVEVHELAGSWIRRLWTRHPIVRDAYQALAWQHQPPLHDYDTLLLTKTTPAWYVPLDTQTVVWYCHSTPRGLYDQFPDTGGGWLTPALKGVMRALYEPNRISPDQWVANSELVARRLALYQGVAQRDVVTVYPPVETTAFDPVRPPTGERYLILGRLRDHKRVDLCLRACAVADVPVDVVGEGPARDHLEALAADCGVDAAFHGYVSEARKARLLSRATALLFAARNEDFGIVPIEAFASGTPVLAVADGYTRHQVRDGENGYLVPFGTGVDGLAGAIRRYEREGVTWPAEQLVGFARQFSTDRFRDRMRHLVETAEQTSAVVAEHQEPRPVAETEAIDADD